MEHTFETYGVDKETTDNLMDYSEGATHLTCWQWDLLHNPIPVWSFLEGDESGMIRKSDENLMNEIVQKLRCAYASSIRKVQLTIPKSTMTPYHIKSTGIDLYATSNIYSSTGGYYEEFTLNETFKKITVGGSCTFQFANNLSIKVLAEKATEFENYLLNNNFDSDVQEIESLVAQNKSILDAVYNSSICLLKNLSAEALVKLIDELSDVNFFTEGYENLTLNIIRAAKNNNFSEAEKQKISTKIMDNFVMFEDDIENLNGLSNYDNFIYGLSDLLNIAYSSRYAESDKNMNDGFYFNGSIPVYVWQDTWTDIITKVEWNKWGNNKYSFDSEKDYNYFLINYEYENYYFNSGTREYEFYPGNMIYVYLEGDIGFAPKGEIIRMPAFQLAYLLDLEQTELKTKTANWVFTPISFVVGAGGLRGASWLYKLWFSYTVADFVLNDVFSIDYKEYIRNQGNVGDIFVNRLEEVETIINVYDAAKGFKYSVEEVQVFKGFFDSWGMLYDIIENDQKIETKRANDMINKLKEEIGYDETIPY